MSRETLVFLASNPKGDGLYHELARRFASAHYIRAGYDVLPPGLRLLPELLEHSHTSIKNFPSVDYKLRDLISASVYREVLDVAERAGPVSQIIFWHALFQVTPKWAAIAPCSAITDVAMDLDYFDNFGIRSEKARWMKVQNRALSMRNLKWLFTHSKWAEQANAKLLPEHASKIVRIGWGSDMPAIPREEALAPRAKPQVVCVGHDYARKGVDLYDQVAGRIAQRIPGAKCVVVGRPGHFDVSKLRFAEALGPLSRADLDRVLRESSLFALLSRFEPAGHVTIEAMSYGLPVICSTEGGIAEPVVDGSTGYHCPINDLDAAAEKACRLLSDPELMARFRENAYDHATADWQWRNVAARVVACLDGSMIPNSTTPAEAVRAVASGSV